MSSPSLRDNGLTRRAFLGATGAAALSVVSSPSLPAWADVAGAASPSAAPESVVKLLYASLTDAQKKVICFDWDHRDPKKGLLRTRVENNWHITPPNIADPFYTGEQRAMIRSIYEGMLNPEWVKKVDQQLKDDAGGFGKSQNIAIFGKPGGGASGSSGDKFELVMTGRHLTLRCDGNSAEHVAFGGPIFHGHAAKGFYEKQDHPGNIFWPQAQEANRLYTMLDGRQRDLALVKAGMPSEELIAFRGKAPAKSFQGIPVTEMSRDQKEQLQKVLGMLVEPYRRSDRDEAIACLKKQGGLDACHLAFYSEADIGDDAVWDNWRLEGPAFVWHFRGKPHVHIWVNVADDPKVELNAFQDSVM
jgi:uncharacterized protein DUF3500